MSASTEQQHLGKFLVNNAELEALNARLSEFNLFRVLRIEKAEIRHSNVLAWLLDPSESHGLGSICLRRVLTTLLAEATPPGVKLTPSQIELMTLGDVEVYRERHNIDILVRSRGGKWCLVIENKIHATESAGQLLKYRAAVEAEFTNHQIIPVLLTLDKDEPSDEGAQAGFVSLSHEDVLDVIEPIIKQHEKRIPDDAQVFLRHYVRSLRRLDMSDQVTIDLCKAIYKRHREALDLINEYGASNEVHEICEKAIPDLVPCSFVEAARGIVWFLPKEMAAAMPNVEMNGWKFLPAPVPPVCLWFRYSKRRQRLKLTLEVGPVGDPDVRKRILKAAETHGISVGAKQYDTIKYARLIAESKKLRDNENGDPDESETYIRQLTRELWAEVWPDAKKIIPALLSLGT